MIHPTLADGESFVEGRSTETAKTLLELAGEDRYGVVITTSHGYIVPSDILPEDFEGAITNADTAAVITQPGTSTNVDEVWNVGGAPTAKAEPESSDDKDVDPDVLAALEAEKAAAADAAKESDQTDHGDEVVPFDPTASTVDEVKEYLAGVDDAERARVIAAEAESAKPRKGITDLAATPEGDK